MSDITRDYSFGGWLRHYRLQKKLTLREAAIKCGLDAGNYSKLERSELSPPSSRKKLEKICLAMEIPDEQYGFLLSLAFQHHLAVLRERFK